MKAKAFINQTILAAVLTIAALAVGQSAWATTKTVTYKITDVSQNSNLTAYNIVFTRSGDDPFDASQTTYTANVPTSSIGQTTGGSGNFSVELADGFLLSLSWSSGSNVTFYNNCISPTAENDNKYITYTVSCPNTNYYYVTHVFMTGMESNFQHGMTQTYPGSGSIDTDYNTIWNFSEKYYSRSSFGQITVTYTDVPLISIFESAGENTYNIKDRHDLRHLANYVNNGHNDCTGLTFQQTQDITCDATYIPIGYKVSSSDMAQFRGTYDGQGFTISGITVSRTGNTDADGYMGLFGYVHYNSSTDYGTVKNVVLANSTFTGYDKVGGIVGEIFNAIVENCRVENTVTINAGHNGAIYHGGIVGESDGSKAKIIGCYSAAVVSANGKSNCKDYGGIVGENNKGTVKDCLYAGNTVTAANKKGAIVGYDEDNKGVFSNNYYTAISLGGIGMQNTSSDQDGARRARTVTLGENVSIVGDETAYSLSGLTAIGTGNCALRYNDGTTTTLYSGEGQTLTLSYTGDVPDGYTACFAVNDNPIEDNTFQMPASNVTVTVTWRKLLTNSDIAIADIDDQTFTGSAICPEVSITDGETTLTQDADYTVEYSNNVNAGTATATITGMGNYAGTVEKTFEIVYQNVTTSYVKADGTAVNDVPAIPLLATMTTLPAGTYVVDRDITYTSRITLSGDVTLILADGCTMNVGTSSNRISGDGINGCDEGNDTWNSLTIYGQTNGTGALSIYTSGAYASSASSAIRANNLTINGGKITAYNSGNESYAIYAKDNLTINRGTVNVTANGQESKGIYAKGGNVTINGGNVTATGYCYGIWAQNSVTISGGNVEATYSAASSSSYTGIYTDGAITLGWTNVTDRIYASSYTSGNDVVTINGFFTDGTDIYGGTVDQPEALAGKTLQPAVAYLDAEGTTQYCTDFTVLTGGSETSLATGWYVVTGEVNYTGQLNLVSNGDYHLILADGCQMNINSNMSCIDIGNNTSVSLTIYGQAKGSGSINATSNRNEGIYVNRNASFTVNGGTVTANGEEEGIYVNTNASFTVNGGSVTATATATDDDSYGIFAMGTVAFNGGTITANGVEYGIFVHPNASFTINGGKVNVTGRYGIYTEGSITLGWTNVSDRIYASSYICDMNIKSGQIFATDDATPAMVSGTVSYQNTLAGKTLQPYGYSLTANEADGNCWTTFYSSQSGFSIETADAYAYTAVYDNAKSQLTLSKLGTDIPAGTAVVIVSATSPVTLAINGTLGSFSGGNDLQGYDVRTSVADIKTTLGDGTLYVMGKVGSNFGFFEYTGAYMPARKAFLFVDGGAALAKELNMVFEEEDADGIGSLTPALSEGEGAIYNLAGQRLNTMQKGINIVNGKKVLK